MELAAGSAAFPAELGARLAVLPVELGAGSAVLPVELAAGSAVELGARPDPLPVLGPGVPLVVSAPLGLAAGVLGAVVFGALVVGAVVVGAAVVGAAVAGAVAFTDLPLPEEVPVGDAVPEETGLVIGLGRTGDCAECADGDAPDRSLVAEAERPAALEQTPVGSGWRTAWT